MKFISRAPARISLCNGGDTDYYINEIGWTNLINATLKSAGYLCEVEPRKKGDIRYQYINYFHKTKKQFKITNAKKDKRKELELITTTISKIHPEFKGSIKIKTNVPEKSGLGGSTSLVVSLIKSLLKSKNEEVSHPEKIAKLAYEIERKILKINGGYQDQWAAAFRGGVNYLEFRKKGVFLEPLWLPEKLMKKLENSLMLFYIEPRKGDSGNIHDILSKRLKTRKKKKDLNFMKERRENVLKTREALLEGNMKKFADLLNYEQLSKQEMIKDILSKNFRKIYETALKNGAVAGKVSGAGYGGCAIFLYPKKNKKKFINGMKSLGCVNIPVKLERLNTMGE